MQDDKRGRRALSARQQTVAVAGFAAVAGLVVLLTAILNIGSSFSQTPPPHLVTFVANARQRATFATAIVTTRLFRTEIVTDGYVAPNGGFAAPGLSSEKRVADGLPLLASQSADVLQAENDLATARTQFRTAQSNEKRQQALYDADGAALKDWQQAQADLATAATSLAYARNRLRIFGKSDAEVAVIERLPVSSSSLVFAVGDSSVVWLIANVREADASLIHVGDHVDVRLSAIPGEVFHSSVDYVASVIDPATHRLVVGARMPNPADKFKPNMQAVISILAGPAFEAPAVPEDAVIFESDSAHVWVSGPNGELALRAITVGRTDGGFTQVTKGLSVGERIVTSGALFLDQSASSG